MWGFLSQTLEFKKMDEDSTNQFVLEITSVYLILLYFHFWIYFGEMGYNPPRYSEEYQKNLFYFVL